MGGYDKYVLVSRIAIAFVVLLVVLAGCSGFSTGSDDPDREPYNVEDPVSPSIEEKDGEELLPGLTTAGLTDSDELQDAHLEAVDNRSHTIREVSEFVVERNNETSRQAIERTIYVDPNDEVVYHVTEQSTDGEGPHQYLQIEQNQTEERWFGDGTVIRTEYEDGEVDYLASEEVEMATDERMAQASQPLFGPLQNPDRMTTAGAIEAEDGTYYVLENDANESIDSEIEEFDVRTLVREDGLVRQTVFERVTESEQVQGADNERVSVTHTVEIDDIGETNVERPDWADDAQSTNSE